MTKGKRWTIGRTDVIVAAALFAGAFIIRIVHVLEIYDTAFFNLNVLRGGDMETFVSWARGIAAGDWIGGKVFWQAPLHPYFLALLLWCSDGSLLFACLIQAFLGAFSCVIVYAAARQVLSPVFAACAGSLLALYDASIFFTAVLHSTTLEVFCASVSLLLFFLAYVHRSRCSWAVLGLSLGLTSLARPNFLLVACAVAVLAAAAAWPRGKWLPGWPQGKRGFALLGVFLVCFWIVVLPVTIRNAVISGRVVVISDSGTTTFRLANSYDSVVFNFAYTKKGLMPIWSGCFWIHQAKKAIAFWSGYEAPQNVNMYLCRRFSSVLRFPLFPFVVIGPLGLVGAFLGRSRFKDLLPPYIFAGVYYISIIPFFVISRFRLPIIPALAVLGAYTVKTIVDFWSGKQRVRALAVAGLVVALGLLSFPWSRTRIRVADLNNLAFVMIKRDENAAAMNTMKESLQRRPGQPAVHLRLGVILATEGLLDEAIDHFKMAVRMRPNDPKAARYLRMCSKLRSRTARDDRGRSNAP